MVRSYFENITNHANHLYFAISQTGVNLKSSSHFSFKLQRKLKQNKTYRKLRPIFSYFDHSNFLFRRKGTEF